MSPEFPYQLITFLDKEPSIDEPVYGGVNGWYPQLTLKRRFKTVDLSEEQLLDMIGKFCASHDGLTIKTGELMQPERMPVRVIEVLEPAMPIELHNDFINIMGSHMVSRYPERDGANYLPHITAEYDGKFVIDVDSYTHRAFAPARVCLIKDADDKDSHVLRYFDFGVES